MNAASLRVSGAAAANATGAPRRTPLRLAHFLAIGRCPVGIAATFALPFFILETRHD